MNLTTNRTSLDSDIAGTQGGSVRTVGAYYFPRRLRNLNEQSLECEVDEARFLATAGPKIVLGEPGMGKSELINELGRRLDVEPVTAIRFMLSRNPSKFIVANRPLLIDGLDEAMARREGDAVDVILAQLEEAGSPDFILSCRAREWQSRSVTNLRQIYKADPTIFTLEALNHKEASAFLVQRYPKADSEHVLDHLDLHGISDLYSNPLTLSLMGRVAEIDVQLPASRAALFERVCTLIWPEHDPDRQDIGLGPITEDQALSAAGAIMAGLLFAGADAVSLAGPLQSQDGDVRLADLEVLPGAWAARAIFSSKLFHSVGVGRAKPIHRVIAEFLAARWLAQQTTSKRTQRRLLGQLHGNGGVPASLRGLHAWLAFHSATMAKEVIASDPFGVLRYGETATLTSEQAEHMFAALHALAEVDPYFRAQDWGDSHTATGLMISNLQTKIEDTIASTKSNGHLRSLLIEALRNTPLAGNLTDTLEAVVISTERFYHERKVAAEALMPHRDREWWQQAVTILHNQGTEDSTRLARNVIEEIGCDVTDEQLVSTLLAEMGGTISPLPRDEKPRTHTIRNYDRIVNVLPTSRLISVLNLLADYSQFLGANDWENLSDLANIVASLITRAIDERVVLPRDAELMWKWLGTLQHAERFRREATDLLEARLDEHDELRRAIQHHALYVARPRPTIWISEIDLRHRMVGLSRRPKDVAVFLERLGEFNNQDPSLREDWCDLMRLGIAPDCIDPDVRKSSRKFQRRDPQLDEFVHKLQYPEKQEWEHERDREVSKREKKRSEANAGHRRHFAENNAALRAGESSAILNPARAYLGLFSDLNRELPPADRIVDWLGGDLAADAMVGFEAALHRTDIPSPQHLVTGFLEGKIRGYAFGIIAGLLARLRANRYFDDLAENVQTIGLLLCYQRHCIEKDEDLQTLTAALEEWVVPTAQARESFARLWIEPSLAARATEIPGLHKLMHDENWLATGAALAPGWLATFPGLPKSIELALVDCLTHAGAFGALACIATAHAGKIPNEEQNFAWLAIDVLVRFEIVQPTLLDIGAQHPEFIWHLRDRLRVSRGGSLLPLSVAQAKWIVSQFRAPWPYAEMEGGGFGSTSPFDATDFIRAMVNRLVNDTSLEASDAMGELVSMPIDSYSEWIRHMAVEQRQKRAEEGFAPLPPKGLAELLTDGPPSNMDDLKSLVLEELAVAQTILRGDDLDQVRDFWNDAGVPYDENRCRDRLAAIIGPGLMHYEVQRITEADMPNTKRADLAFARGQLQLPMEVKGQWHPEVWLAATDQLDLKYLIDWRSEQRGIYCVLWFGELPSASGRRLKAPPNGLKAPKSAEELRKMLSARIPESRRFLIEVVVLDLSAGKS